MYEKGNRYLADWYDRKGKRRRKSFATPEEAEQYEAAQKNQSHPKKVRAGHPSPRQSPHFLQNHQQKPQKLFPPKNIADLKRKSTRD